MAKWRGLFVQEAGKLNLKRLDIGLSLWYCQRKKFSNRLYDSQIGCPPKD
jgi:hypothetical protein